MRNAICPVVIAVAAKPSGVYRDSYSAKAPNNKAAISSASTSVARRTLISEVVFVFRLIHFSSCDCPPIMWQFANNHW